MKEINVLKTEFVIGKEEILDKFGITINEYEVAYIYLKENVLTVRIHPKPVPPPEVPDDKEEE